MISSLPSERNRSSGTASPFAEGDREARPERARRRGASPAGTVAGLALLAFFAGVSAAGGAASRDAASPWGSSSSRAGVVHDGDAPDDPCAPGNLELSSPRGKVLSSRLILRWRASGQGPFQVSILDADNRTVYAADTYGHELRILVGGEAAPGAPDAQLHAGRSYRWKVVPQFAPNRESCPTAGFRLLPSSDAAREAARFQAAARRLGVEDEDREPGASIELARLYLKEGFLEAGESVLQELRRRAHEDGRIEKLLADLYRNTGRELSLRALAAPAGEGPGPF